MGRVLSRLTYAARRAGRPHLANALAVLLLLCAASPAASETPQDSKQAFAQLQAEAAKTHPKPGDVLYPLATKPLFADRPAAADAPPDGRLLAASAVKVLSADGGWLQVEIAGWQQQGNDAALFALQGKRILMAALGKPAQAKVQHGSPVTDPDSNLVWQPTTLTAWLSDSEMLPEVQPLWAYGQQMYGEACGGCHTLQPTTFYPANQWIGFLNSMRSRISLDDEQLRFLQKYVQMHARDMPGAQ
jgi:trimethylamine-N-oxide reductase cytochrome c-type subunit TorC